MLEVIFAQDSKVEDMFCGASSGSEPSLFFSNYFFSSGFKSFQDDLQHDFARKTDEADSSVVLAAPQVAFYRECNNQRLSLWGRPFCCSLDPVTGLCENIDHGLPASLNKVFLYITTPAGFPFFSDAAAILTSSRRIGCTFSTG